MLNDIANKRWNFRVRKHEPQTRLDAERVSGGLGAARWRVHNNYLIRAVVRPSEDEGID
jgi:hypothetical protein